MKKNSKSNNQLVIFSNHSIRRIFHNQRWWFVIVDVVAALTDSAQPAGYVEDMRQRDPQLNRAWPKLVRALACETAGGIQKLNCAKAEISKAAFGLTPTEYKKLKGLKRESLRDHMSDLELIFTMLGEASTTEITRETDAQGFPENKAASKAGGEVAGNARKDLERRSRKKVCTAKNYRALLNQRCISAHDKN